MNRRRFLAISVSPLLAGVAGCSSPQDGSSGLTIRTVELENLTNHETVFDVAIVNEAETALFETEQPVAGGSAVALDQPVDEPGRYTISLAADGQALTQDVSLFASVGDECVVAVGRLTGAEQLQIEGLATRTVLTESHSYYTP